MDSVDRIMVLIKSLTWELDTNNCAHSPRLFRDMVQARSGACGTQYQLERLPLKSTRGPDGSERALACL